MKEALLIFANGMLGVFVGMGVLYLTMKVISLIARGEQTEEKQP